MKDDYAVQYCRNYCGALDHAPSVVRIDWRYAQCITCSMQPNGGQSYEFVAFPDELVMFPPPKYVRILPNEEFEYKDGGTYIIDDLGRRLRPKSKYRKYTVTAGPSQETPQWVGQAQQEQATAGTFGGWVGGTLPSAAQPGTIENIQ